MKDINSGFTKQQNSPLHYKKWCLLMVSHHLSQQDFSSYFGIMTEPASDFKNEYCHYSLQYYTEASLERNKEQNAYSSNPHFLWNVWIKLQTVVLWELNYVLKQCFWRSERSLEIGLWLACEFSNTDFFLIFCYCSCHWILHSGTGILSVTWENDELLSE